MSWKAREKPKQALAALLISRRGQDLPSDIRRQEATPRSCEVKHGVSHIVKWQIAASNSGNCACRAPRWSYRKLQPKTARPASGAARACVLSKGGPWRRCAPCASPAGLAAVPTEPRRDRVVFRAFRSVKSPARALRRGPARALLWMAHSKTPTERRAAASLNSRPCAAADCRCPTRCPPRRREVDATAAPVT